MGFISAHTAISSGATTCTVADIAVPANADYALFKVALRGADDGATTLSSVTLDSIAFTFNNTTMRQFDGTFASTTMGYMLATDISSGTVDAVATRGTGTDGFVFTVEFYEDIAQQAPEVIALNSNGSTDSLTTNITTLTDGAILSDVLSVGQGALNPAGGAGQTQSIDQDSTGIGCAGSYKTVATASADSMSWALDSADRVSHVVFSLETTAGGGSGAGKLTNSILTNSILSKSLLVA